MCAALPAIAAHSMPAFSMSMILSLPHYPPHNLLLPFLHAGSASTAQLAHNFPLQQPAEADSQAQLVAGFKGRWRFYGGWGSPQVRFTASSICRWLPRDTEQSTLSMRPVCLLPVLRGIQLSGQGGRLTRAFASPDA